MTALAVRDPLPVLTEAVAAGVQTSRPRVLLLHESSVARDILDATLSRAFEIRHARDAEDAWRTVMVDPSICAVVASLPVLEIDGYGMLQRMRGSKVARVAHLPMLIVDEDNEQMCELATSFGADDVAPSSALDTLSSRLNELLDAPERPRRPRAVRPAPPRRHAQAAPLTTPSLAPPPPKLATAPASAGDSPAFKEYSMARLESLNKVLKALQNSSPGVEASALISSDGLMIASALAQDMDETRVAAMTATLLSLGSRAATELRRGDVAEVIVRGEHGYAVMLSAGRGTLLLVLATEATPLGLIFFDMREAIKQVKTIL